MAVSPAQFLRPHSCIQFAVSHDHDHNVMIPCRGSRCSRVWYVYAAYPTAFLNTSVICIRTSNAKCGGKLSIVGTKDNMKALLPTARHVRAAR
jgi:hypothetical protein